jgi:type I restriction enzyme S subunit
LNERNFRPKANAENLKSLILPDCPKTIQDETVLISQGQKIKGYEDLYAEIEAALSEYDKAQKVQDLLSNQLSQLENLNQAILQEAVQGKLVKQNPNDEPANELLKRIKTEKTKSGKKEKPLPPIKAVEIPFEIPESWVWCRLGDVTLSMTNGIYKHDKFYNENGIGCLRMYNIKDGVINFNNLKRMILTPQELDTYSLQKNDILLNRVNSIELLGKAGLVNDLSEPLVFESKNIRVRFAENETLPSYLTTICLLRFIKSQF